MALRGDLVGEAYVRITADTSAMRDAIKRDGERDGKAYINSFTKQVEQISDDRLRRVQTRLAAAMSDPKEFDRLAKNYANVSEAADDFRVILRKLRAENKIATGELRKHITEVNRWEKSTIARNKAAEESLLLEKQENEAIRIRNKSLQHFFRIQTESYNQRVKAVVALQKAQESGNASLVDHERKWVRWSRITVIGVDRVTERTDRFNHILGRTFGKGSRNNFLNWTGSMVQGLAQLAVSVVTFPMKALAHVTNTFGTAFSAARVANVGRLASVGKGLLAVFGGKTGIIGAIAGLGVAAFGFGKVLPGVISLMTSLGGVVSALVGSISIGLTGALLGVAPAAAGAAAGLGGLASVFVAFFQDEKNKDFVTNFLKPFKDMNTSYVPKVKTFLTNVRSGFHDLIHDIKPSIDAFFTSFSKKMNDPSTKSALGKWSDSLGRIATSFSQAGTSFLSGLTGFFVPMLPYAERFANYIEKAAAAFDKWANSEDGRKGIAAFMSKAWADAQLIWGIVQDIAGIVGSVFMGGDETGGSFLNGIHTKLQEIDDLLKTPEGKKKLSEWFGNVKKIGDDIGTLAVNVGKIIAAFNSPEGQKNAEAILGAIVKVSEIGISLAGVADDVGRLVSFLINPALSAVLAIIDSIKNGGAVASDPSKPAEGGSVQRLIDGPTIDFKTSINGEEFKGGFDTAVSRHLGLSAEQEKQLAGYVIPFKPDTVAYDQTKAIVEMYKFTDKVVPIKGNETAWNATKGTVAGYAFDSKEVVITANAEPARRAIENVRRWLAGLKDKTIRVAGVNSTGGITMARGGILTRPTQVTAGEAGREAFVPLDRPLNQVDPAVRALSAIAQGKASMASGGVVGATRTINVHPGAIVVQSPHSNPALVAEQVLDRLVAFG